MSNPEARFLQEKREWEEVVVEPRFHLYANAYLAEIERCSEQLNRLQKYRRNVFMRGLDILRSLGGLACASVVLFGWFTAPGEPWSRGELLGVAAFYLALLGLGWVRWPGPGEPAEASASQGVDQKLAPIKARRDDLARQVLALDHANRRLIASAIPAFLLLGWTLARLSGLVVL